MEKKSNWNWNRRNRNYFIRILFPFFEIRAEIQNYKSNRIRNDAILGPKSQAKVWQKPRFRIATELWWNFYENFSKLFNFFSKILKKGTIIHDGEIFLLHPDPKSKGKFKHLLKKRQTAEEEAKHANFCGSGNFTFLIYFFNLLYLFYFIFYFSLLNFYNFFILKHFETFELHLKFLCSKNLHS